jgi:hypothetical protein
MQILRFATVALLLLFASLGLGGRPWAFICMLALLTQCFNDLRLKSLMLIAPSLDWTAAFHWTGNRELFFPFSIYLAAYVAVVLSRRNAWLGLLGGTIVTAAFVVVRIRQFATVPVLAVEIAAASVILVLALVAYAFSPKSNFACFAVCGMASLIAYACLFI